MIAQRRERRRARATGQIPEAKLKIPPLSETFLHSLRETQPSEQMVKRSEPATASPSPQLPIYVTAIDSQEDITDPFAVYRMGSSSTKRISSLPPLPLATSSRSIRKWESIPIMVHLSPNHGPFIAYPIRVRPFLCVSFFI